MQAWQWIELRVWSPFVKCDRSKQRLFGKIAYYGVFFQDWEYCHDYWLSEREYLLAVLRGEFS